MLASIQDLKPAPHASRSGDWRRLDRTKCRWRTRRRHVDVTITAASIRSRSTMLFTRSGAPRRIVGAGPLSTELCRRTTPPTTKSSSRPRSKRLLTLSASGHLWSRPARSSSVAEAHPPLQSTRTPPPVAGIVGRLIIGIRPTGRRQRPSVLFVAALRKIRKKPTDAKAVNCHEA